MRAEGPNELPSARGRSVLAIAFDVVREPMILLLVGCATVYLVLGDLEEALALLGSVFVVIGISLYQTQKTERALEALRDLSSPRALVIRDGRERRIAGREVVQGDLLVLSEGDRVPADAVVLRSTNLRVDESLLTGESVPVTKIGGREEAVPERPGGEASPFVYSATLVVAGQGVARATATGARSEIGKLGRSLEGLDSGETRLQRQVDLFVRVFGIAGLAVCVVVATIYGFGRASWLEGLLAGLALAMSMMPEEFPVILTLFLALGAWRISRRNVLVRRMPALEALGAATVLCVDKTGTLTQNRMALGWLSVNGQRLDLRAREPGLLPETYRRLLEFAVLASQESPFDPMEKSINEAGGAWLSGSEHLHRGWTLERQYPLSQQLLAVSHVWKSADEDRWVVAAKGAPEAIEDLCHLDEPHARAVADEAAALAEEGLRVLGVAAALLDATALPAEQHDFSFEFLGLIALSDPLRPAARGAVAECTAAGVRTVMITGDYPGTARSIAAQIGLASRDGLLTGPELEAMSRDELRKRIEGVAVFARVVPDQKLRLVEALRARGEVVAMTGDGVNDAPALKAADIGIAMGSRGTDVAREAADLVLLDDDFSSIVAAIRLGRRVYDNIKRATRYVLAIHIPIAGLALVPVLFGWPLVLLPVHIVFLELIIDPACSIAFEAEPEEADVMRRPPRQPTERLFGFATVWRTVLQGVLALLLTCGVLTFAVYSGYAEERSRALAFSTLILVNVGLIVVNRSASRGVLAALGVRNPVLWWVIGGALTMLALTLTLPPLRDVLRFEMPSGRDFLTISCAGVLGLVGFDLLKDDTRPGRRSQL
jgi:Ca2+-transporting ATPase